MDEYDLYPLLMRPEYKDYVWGGDTLKSDFNKDTPYKKTAESWEVATHKDGTSCVDNGKFKGMPLDKVIDVLKEELLGSLIEDGKMPLIFKLIDADEKLSIQVNPDNVYAKEFENGSQGKIEMWYILDAKYNSKLVYGFKEEVTKEEVLKAIKNKEVDDILNYVKVKKGDVFFIDAGIVHAIGEGIVIAEIQQNSNLTYRVYDWDRAQSNGKPRELQIEKALEVSTLEGAEDEKMPILKIEESECVRTMLSCCRYFAAEKVEVNGHSQEKTDGRSFHIIFFSRGDGEIKYNSEKLDFECGQTYLIPAEMGKYKIKGKCEYLKYYVPDFDKDFLEPLVNAGHTEDEVVALVK